MACKVMDGLQREFKAAQEKYAQFGYETYRSVRGVSEHKAKQLVREAKEEMAVLRGRMKFASGYLCGLQAVSSRAAS